MTTMQSRPVSILIAGAGAVGCTYGARLLNAGHRVTFLARDATVADLRQHGLTVRSIDGDLVFPTVDATTQPSEHADVILLTASANATAALIPRLAPAVGPNTILCSLQNGLGNEALIESAWPEANVVGGVAFIGARRLAPCIIEHRDQGHVTIGPWRDRDLAAAERLHALLTDAGIRSRLTDDIRVAIWKKLLWNLAFNTTSALSGAWVHEVLDVEGGEQLCLDLMHEARAVAAAEGIQLPADLPDRILRDTANLRWTTTSMSLAREAGDLLEVEPIAGEVLRRAAKHDIEVPLTRAVAVLLRAWNKSRRRTAI
ncbi:MAG: ketopantoate reductase family protein [Candidatus Dadabacteria bacterium]|nr:MAG: ketopantoate reductase family protein [Candidatus Dadabacteria bacterium]